VYERVSFFWGLNEGATVRDGDEAISRPTSRLLVEGVGQDGEEWSCERSEATEVDTEAEGGSTVLGAGRVSTSAENGVFS